MDTLQDNSFLSNMFQSISNCQQINQLNIQLIEGKINTQGVIFLGEQIAKLTNLQTLILNLSLNPLFAVGQTQLMLMLQQCQNLERIQVCLDSCRKFKNEELFQGLDMSKMKKLEYFFFSLCNNNVERMDLVNLAKGFYGCKTIKQLQLQLLTNRLSCECIIPFGKELENCQNLEEIGIDFSSNRIGSFGVYNFGRSTSKLQKLKGLQLYYLACPINLIDMGDGRKLHAIGDGKLCNTNSLINQPKKGKKLVRYQIEA